MTVIPAGNERAIFQMNEATCFVEIVFAILCFQAAFTDYRFAKLFQRITNVKEKMDDRV